MNKKVLLLFVLGIISTLAFTVFAGDPACGLGGCSAATVSTTTGTSSVINFTLTNFTTINMTWNPLCGNATANGSCFNLSSQQAFKLFNLSNCNATADVMCDAKTLEYLNQVFNITCINNISYVDVKGGSAFFAAIGETFMGQTIVIGKTDPATGVMTANPYETQSGLWTINNLKWGELSDGTPVLALGGFDGFTNDLLGFFVKVDSTTAKTTEQIGAVAAGGAINGPIKRIEVAADTVGSHAMMGFTTSVGTPHAYVLVLNTHEPLVNFTRRGKYLDDLFFAGSGSEMTRDGIIPLDGTYSAGGITRQAFGVFGTSKHTANGGQIWTPFAETIRPDDVGKSNAVYAARTDDSSLEWWLDDVAEIYGNGDQAMGSGRFQLLGGNYVISMLKTNALSLSEAKPGSVIKAHKYNSETTSTPPVLCSPDKSKVFIAHTRNDGNTNIFVYGTQLNRLKWFTETSGDALQASAEACGSPAVLVTLLNNTANNGSRVFVLQGSNAVSAFNILNMTVDSAAVLDSRDTGGHGADWLDFVLGGHLSNNISFGVLDYFNTSTVLDALNPNGSTRFTTDKVVRIQTFAPDINILNFQLDFQNFNGSFDTTLGTCDNCSFDGANVGWCQAEVEKVWGMFESYNMTINLSTNDVINLTRLRLVCRSFNETVALNSNCSGLSPYGTGATGCFTPGPATAGISRVSGNALIIELTVKNWTNSIDIPLGTMQPDTTCEQIACELTGTWSVGDPTQNFIINKSITATAN